MNKNTIYGFLVVLIGIILLSYIFSNGSKQDKYIKQYDSVLNNENKLKEMTEMSNKKYQEELQKEQERIKNKQTELIKNLLLTYKKENITFNEYNLIRLYKDKDSRINEIYINDIQNDLYKRIPTFSLIEKSEIKEMKNVKNQYYRIQLSYKFNDLYFESSNQNLLFSYKNELGNNIVLNNDSNFILSQFIHFDVLGKGNINIMIDSENKDYIDFIYNKIGDLKIYK